jgi:flagellin-like hook-associated protein FlgL
MTAKFFEYLGWVSLSPNLKESFSKTLLDAEQHRHGTVEIEHLLLALIDDPEGAIALTQMGVDRDKLRNNIADHLDAIPAGDNIKPHELQPSRTLKKLMAKASDQADSEHDDHIDGGDVIHALGEFKASNSNLDFLQGVQIEAEAKPAQKRSTRQRSRKAGDETVEDSPSNSQANELNFDVDPIKASIKAIMARRSEAENILLECEWYHLFKSLNMIDAVLGEEEQVQRTNLLARAEKELAERPRCRKAFLYVRYLDNELDRLKGIVDIDWAGDITPDETVRELDRLRSQSQKNTTKSKKPTGSGSELGEHLQDVKVQESEVLAIEQKLQQLDKTAGTSENRLKELEGHLESHDTHSKKRENVIGELERYLRSEMQMADARDKRIIELEKQLHDNKSISDGQVDKTSLLQDELKAFKEHAGNREMHISDLEAKLKAEKETATSHEEQVGELRTMLDKEKNRAEAHNQQVEKLQKTFEEEQLRAAAHEQQVLTLEADLKSRQEQLQAREEHIKDLQEDLSAKENHMAEREEQVKKLEADLFEHANQSDQHKLEINGLHTSHLSEVQKLLTNIEDQEGESRQHHLEISALRAQLGSLENRLQDQETAYSDEKVNLSNTIEEMRREIEESESLIEIIHATGEPYRVKSDVQTGDEAVVKIVSRRTIPVAAKRDDS